MKGIKRVVNVSVKYIRPKYKDIHEWLLKKRHVYIGRNVVYVGINASKWANPYSAKKMGLDKCLSEYETYVRKNLYDDLEELSGKTVGCWCKPNKCHGDVLKKLLDEKIGKTNK